MSVVLGYKFAAIPEWILYHPELSGDDVRVYGVLARYGNDIRPSQGAIAAKISKSADTVKRCLHRLADVGAVFVEARFEDGAALPNRYHLAGDEPIRSAPSGSTAAPRGGCTDATGVGAPVLPEREQDNESKNNEKPPTPPSPRKRGALAEADRQFDTEFFVHYPTGKPGKGQARTFWREKMTKPDRAAAIEGIQRHAAWWTEHGTELTFIPASIVWLHQRRWEDPEPRQRLQAVDTDKVLRSRQRRAARAAAMTQTGSQT